MESLLPAAEGVGVRGKRGEAGTPCPLFEFESRRQESFRSFGTRYMWRICVQIILAYTEKH